MKKLTILLFVLLLITTGCATQTGTPNQQFAYLPDGRMVLLQSSGEDKPVEFSDANLELVIRETLEGVGTLAAGETIYTNDLEEVVYLDASGKNITSLKGLEYCINLGVLNLGDNNISDLTSISKLPGALVCTTNNKSEIVSTHTCLNLLLWKNNVSDISVLSELSRPDELTLSLSFNSIEDIRALTKLTNLICLYLNENRVSDLSPLAGLTNLTGLEMLRNQITDLSSLVELHSLGWLELFGNQIVDVSPLEGLLNLDMLGLACNRIVDVKPLASLTNLRNLNLASNLIVDASPLEVLKDTTIILDGNPLEIKP